MPGTWEYSLGWDPEVKKFRPMEYRTARHVMEERDVTLTRIPKGRQGDWLDEHGIVYDAVGGFPGQFLDQQWDRFVWQIHHHLSKAELVPVDVSGFTAEQIKRIQKVVAPLSPRVFIVGK